MALAAVAGTAAVLWVALYRQLAALPEWATAKRPGAHHSHAGEAIALFLHDVPSVPMLLTLVIFASGRVRRLIPAQCERACLAAVREIASRVRVWIRLGIGAGIHGPLPDDPLAGIMGAEDWWPMPAVMLTGISVYTHAAGVIPIVEALLGKGAAIGTVMAFVMRGIALSRQAMLFPRQVVQARLIAPFLAVVAAAIPRGALSRNAGRSRA